MKYYIIKKRLYGKYLSKDLERYYLDLMKAKDFIKGSSYFVLNGCLNFEEYIEKLEKGK